MTHEVGERFSKQLLIDTSSNQGATLAFTWSRVSDHLMNISPKCTLFQLCFWSLPTPTGVFSLDIKTKFYFLKTHLSLSLCSDTVECYNLKKNEWTFVTNMVEPHYGHAGTVHGDLMYISGMFNTQLKPYISPGYV